VKGEPQGIVAVRAGFGGTRIVDMLVGEQLPNWLMTTADAKANSARM
jgi:hypothetical protein